jgi:prepilin-type N-terminal cleavage/methylation domain-containing protein
MKRNQSGFTLIEIAIVLVIIGLLLGGVLKGQELINSAKVKNLGTDFRNIPVYIYGYQDKYRAVPGDDSQAASHVGTAADPCSGGVGHCLPGNGLIEGAWDSTTATDESQLFWQQVRLAGLAAGPTTGDMLPTNSVGGVIGITSGAYNPDTAAAATRLPGTYIICSAGILGKFASQLDTQMDDGAPTTGSIREYNTTATRPTTLSTPTVSSGQLDPNLTYTVCMGV